MMCPVSIWLSVMTCEVFIHTSNKAIQCRHAHITFIVQVREDNGDPSFDLNDAYVHFGKPKELR